MRQIINQRFAKSFVLRQADRHVKAFMEGLGRERIDKMVRLDLSLETLLPPDRTQELRMRARLYSWATQAITEEDFLHMLPSWYGEVIAQHGEKGQEWQARELKVLRSFFGG